MGEVGFVMEVEWTHFLTSCLGSANDRTIKDDFSASSLDNLIDRVPLLRWRQMWGPGIFGGKINLYNNPMNNRHYSFFYIMDEKLEPERDCSKSHT